MGADNGRHEVGDIVTPSPNKHLMGGLEYGEHYEIININRGIDGAYDFDEIWLEGATNPETPGWYGFRTPSNNAGKMGIVGARDIEICI